MIWQTSDSARFRQYDQQTGGRLRIFLKAIIPKASGESLEKYALSASYKEGAEFIVSKLDEILLDENKQDDASSASFTSM